MRIQAQYFWTVKESQIGESEIIKPESTVIAKLFSLAPQLWLEKE